MKLRLRAATLCMLTAPLAACGGRWVPDLPDFSSWFDRENRVQVEEVMNQTQCNAPGEQPGVQLLPDAAAVRNWEAARGVALTGGTPLPAGPYAVVDLGQRRTGGHGIAVSRQAGLKGGVLVLKATTFAPRADQAVTQALTSPCALVRLPRLGFDSLQVLDQSGRVLASTGASAGPAP